MIAEQLRKEITPDEDNCLYVKCGELIGRLYLSLFFCPGLHEYCLQLPDGRVVTPKQFIYMSGRSKHKDWKGSLTVHKKSLRWLMDMGIVKFADHAKKCTKRCSSTRRSFADDMWERQLCSHPIYPAVANSNNDWQPKPTVVFATQDPGDVIASTDAQAAPYVILSATPINVDKLPRARLDATAKWYMPVPKATQNQQPTTREAGSIWTDDTAAEVEEVPPEEGQQQPEENVTTAAEIVRVRAPGPGKHHNLAFSESDAIWNQLKGNRQVLMAMAGKVFQDIVNDPTQQEDLNGLAELMAKHPTLVQRAQALLDKRPLEVTKRRITVEEEEGELSRAKKVCPSQAAYESIFADL